MPLKDLSDSERELVLQCLNAMLDDDAIEDWEFQTRLGVTRPVVRRIISQRPGLDDGIQGSDEFLAVNNCMNEVCNGIRMTPVEWAKRFTESRNTILLAYKNRLKLRG